MGRIIKPGESKKKPVSISKDVVEAAKTLIEARQAAVRMREDSRNDVIDLALYMASKIVGQIIETDPVTLENIYREAFRSARDLDMAIVHVNPQDRQISNIDGLAKSSGFEVVEDPSLDRAGCRITAGGTAVDATLSTVLELFANSMKRTGLDGA